MFAIYAYDQIPSLLLQCGYRSKVCTNPRATKIDGTLHRLCEFHRRKANLSQQRLHKRHREERAARRAEAAIVDRPTKRVCPAPHFQLDLATIDPIPYVAIAARIADTDAYSVAAVEHFQRGLFTGEPAFSSLVDVTKPVPSGIRQAGSAASVDDTRFMIV